jgi:hypothetical protein
MMGIGLDVLPRVPKLGRERGFSLLGAPLRADHHSSERCECGGSEYERESDWESGRGSEGGHL